MKKMAELDVLSSKGVKPEIVKVLALEFPLNARQVFQRIKDKGVTVSYQAVHKALGLLEAEGVVCKEKQGYVLNQKWILSNKQFFEQTEAKYAGKSTLSFKDVPLGSSVSLSFDSYWNALIWILYEMKRVYEERKKHDVIAVYFFHPWPLTALSKDDYEKLKVVMNVGEHYAICPNQNPLDCLLLDFWRKIGKIVENTLEVNRECESITAYEYLVQIYLSKKLRKKLDEFYEKEEKLDAHSLDKLYKIIYDDKSKTDLVVIRNSEIANNARESVLKNFNKKLVEKGGVLRAV